jgi:hypothetical protein
MASLREVDGLKIKLLFVPRSAMFKHKHSVRKPDPLLLLVILVGLAVLVTSTASAAAPAFNVMRLTDLRNGDLVVAPVGRQGAGFHLSYQTNPYRYQAPAEYRNDPVSSQAVTSPPTFFLSVHIPW